jgi:hypothetical protein
MLDLELTDLLEIYLNGYKKESSSISKINHVCKISFAGYCVGECGSPPVTVQFPA